tara:strand:+ start:1285 stop:2157 length:873 start_codon:yes stop_codon:yes gene_type:complete
MLGDRAAFAHVDVLDAPTPKSCVQDQLDGPGEKLETVFALVLCGLPPGARNRGARGGQVDVRLGPQRGESLLELPEIQREPPAADDGICEVGSVYRERVFVIVNTGDGPSTGRHEARRKRATPAKQIYQLHALRLTTHHTRHTQQRYRRQALKPNSNFPTGALASLQVLGLTLNQISDEGMKAFSSALSSGALGSLAVLGLSGNQISDDGMKAFVSAISSGALASLTKLCLNGNQIGDEGVKAFSTALTSGALVSLTYLDLSYNWVGDEGMKALSSALISGTLQVRSIIL